MANKKITELNSADLPLDFTEEAEIVQDGESKRVAVSEFGINLPFVTFNTSPTPGAHVAGKLYWDADAGTMSFMTDITNVVLQVGQEQYVKARNNSGSLIPNGSPVYISGALGNRPTIDLAQADTVEKSRVLGLTTEAISNNADGYVTVNGLVRDLDTSSFSAGDSLWISDAVAGELLNAEPPTGYPAILGVCIYSHNNQGIILVRIILLN